MALTLCEKKELLAIKVNWLLDWKLKLSFFLSLDLRLHQMRSLVLSSSVDCNVVKLHRRVNPVRKKGEGKGEKWKGVRKREIGSVFWKSRLYSKPKVKNSEITEDEQNTLFQTFDKNSLAVHHQISKTRRTLSARSTPRSLLSSFLDLLT